VSWHAACAFPFGEFDEAAMQFKSMSDMLNRWKQVCAENPLSGNLSSSSISLVSHALP
jgi:hypothetical protein